MSKIASNTLHSCRAFWQQHASRSVKAAMITMLLLLTGNRTFSQQSNIYFDHLSTADNLSQNSVLFILQDSDGFMWFATQAGLDKYDGIDFQHFANVTNDPHTIKGGFVNTLYEDKSKKQLWVGTTLGLSSMSLGDNYKVTHYYFKDGTPEQNIIAIAQDDGGTIWVATTHNIYYLEQGIFVPAGNGLASIGINHFTIDATGKWGLVATAQGIFAISLDKKRVLTKLFIEWLDPDIAVNKVAFYKEDIIIALEKNVYLIERREPENPNKFPDKFKIARELKYEHEYKYNKKTYRDTLGIVDCMAILTDKEGNIWFGTRRKGLIRIPSTLDTGKEFVRDFSSSKSLSSTYIYSLGESRDGTLWIGTDGGGVNKYSGEKPAFFRYFTSNFQHVDMAPNIDLWSIYQLNKEELLLGTDGNGIVKFNLSTRRMVEHYFNRGEIASNIVRAVAGMDSSLLIGTPEGLFIAPLRDLKAYKKKKKALDQSVSSVLATANHIWAGTSTNGLAILDRNFAEQGHLFNGTSPARRINTLVKINDQDILAGTSAGCFLIGPSNGTFKVKDTILAGYYVTCIAQKNDSVWIGTKGEGLFCIDKKTGRQLLSFNRENGLIDPSIYGILDDGAGKIWFSTNKGISVYLLQDSSFNHYTRQYGLQHDEFNLGACSYNTKIDRFRAFFGGVNGLNAFNPMQISIQRKKQDIGLFFYSGNDTTKLITSPGGNLPLRFEVDPMEDFTKLAIRTFDYQDPNNDKYKYRLNNGAWSGEQPIKEPLIIARSDLKRLGRNSLEIVLRTSNGTWIGLNPVAIKLPIDPEAEYKYSGTPTLIVLIGLFSILLLLAMFYERKSRQLKKQKEKTEQGQLKLEVTNKKLQYNVQQLEEERKKYKQLSEELELKSNELELQNEELKEFQELLDEVTKCRDLSGLKQIVLKHLTTSKNFQFDYAIFCDVDYFGNEIIVNKPALRNHENGQPVNTQEWEKIEREISLKSDEITAIAVESDTIIEVNGSEIITKMDCTASCDQHIYKAFGHHELMRLLAPVSLDINLNGATKSTEPTMALLEVGYNKKGITQFEETQKTKISIYANNLAFSYKRLSEKLIETMIQETVAESIIKSNEKHLDFLQLIFTGVCLKIKATYGCITFRSFNHSSIADDKISIKFPNDKNWDSHPLRKLITYRSLEAGITVRSNNMDYQKDNEIEQHSYLSIPIKYGDVIIGCAEIFSSESAFFNAINTSFAESVFQKAGTGFVSMKFHNSVTDLVSPTFILREPEESLKPVITSIRDYFRCDYISIWMRDHIDDKTEFKQIKASDGIETKCKNYGKKNKLIDDNSIQDLKAINLATINPDSENASFWEFAKENDLRSFIHVPMRIGEHSYGFINIYSKRSLDADLFTEDKQFLELVANKSIVSFVTSKMLSNFSNISQSLAAKNLKTVLQRIADSAREVLNAEPVLLFRYDKGAILYKETIHSGFLYNKDRLFEGRNSNFLEVIIKRGEGNFYKSADDLPSEYEFHRQENGKDEENFWLREKIKALAVIVLKHEGNTIGLMCFNYRKEQNFSPYVTHLINAFSALASTAINNMNQVTIIREQREQLQVKAEKIQFEYEKIYDKMQDMLPSAKRTSLLDIIRQINHDIINQLLLIKMDLLTLNANSKELVRTEKDRKALKENIESLNININRSNNLIKLFNPMSFKETFEDFNAIIISVSKLFESRYKIDEEETAIDIDLSGLGNIQELLKCSKAEMAMIIYNLISNSDKAIKEKIDDKSITTTKSFKGRIQLSSGYNAKTKTFHFEITDNGIGIDKEDLPSIYEPGVTSRKNEINVEQAERVHGIGLFFVKESLISHYDGSIECDSYRGNYTTFKITLKNITN